MSKVHLWGIIIQLEGFCFSLAHLASRLFCSALSYSALLCPAGLCPEPFASVSPQRLSLHLLVASPACLASTLDPRSDSETLGRFLGRIWATPPLLNPWSDLNW